MLRLTTRDRHAEARRRAVAAVDAELARLRDAGPAEVRALLAASPIERAAGGVALTTRVEAEGDRLLVLAEAWRGRRTLATGGFAMGPDGTTHTPH